MDSEYLAWEEASKWVDWHLVVKAHCQSCGQYTMKSADADSIHSFFG